MSNYKYGTILKHKTDGYQVKIGMCYNQSDIPHHFVIFSDGSNRLLRQDVIEFYFEEVK